MLCVLTDYVGVAWILTTSNRVGLSDIRAVDIWPGGIGDKVPSEYTYSANSGQSWGYGIGNNAYVIRWTKLELEKPARLDALLALSRTIGEAGQLNFGPQNVVRSEIPRHLIRNASNIVTDYLYEVALVARRDIESLKDPQTLSQFPIDFVITHPAVSLRSRPGVEDPLTRLIGMGRKSQESYLQGSQRGIWSGVLRGECKTRFYSYGDGAGSMRPVHDESSTG